MKLLNTSVRFSFSASCIGAIKAFILRYETTIIFLILGIISIGTFIYFYQNGLGLAYNDARSHLDIGRRVVENLNPGAAQLGSVWLPLTHLLMGVTIWNDFMWHSGLAGALWSMISFVATGLVISLFLKELGIGFLGRFVGVAIFVANINTLYLQSTAMTELTLLGTMTVGAYYLLRWFKTENSLYLIYSAFFIMLATLVRYDAWFMLFFAASIITLYTFKKYGYHRAEGIFIFFCTLAGLGVVLWLLWNLLIFKDPLYFAFGPYSAHAQQDQLNAAGVLPSKGNWLFSLKVYMYAMAYNTGAFTMFLGFLAAIFLWLDKKISIPARIASSALIAPLLFNILALYLGHSVLYIQGISGDTWFNVRYGIMMLPSIAIFVGYLVGRVKRPLGVTIIGLLAFVTFFQFSSADAVTIDDARVGSSQKNVTEVSGWLRENTKDKPGFILISAASHDSVIFSSGLPMKKFIHEGAGAYYDAALANPDRWARWIVVRSYSNDDSTWRAMVDNPGFQYYQLVDHYPFADIYELKAEYLPDLITEPILPKQW